MPFSRQQSVRSVTPVDATRNIDTVLNTPLLRFGFIVNLFSKTFPFDYSWRGEDSFHYAVVNPFPKGKKGFCRNTINVR
jgi:hypothetical protein